MLRGTGETFITAGVVVLLFVVYLLYWTGFQNSRTQDRLGRDLVKAWAQGSPTTAGSTGTILGPGVPQPVVARLPALGAGLGRIYVPRIALARVMVEGTTTADLQEGPGHVPGTPMAGELGNFSVSGHRTTYGQPFNRLDEVLPKDHVVVETRTDFVTYRVTGQTDVDPNDGIVVTDSTPAIGAQPPTATRLLTFTTCTPKYSAEQRLILRAVWERTDAKSALSRAPYQRPPALQPGAV